MPKPKYQIVKEWRKKNPEKVLEQARRYRAKHPETSKKAKAKYRSINLHQIRESDRVKQDSWRKKNPEQQKVRENRWKEKRELELTRIAGRPRQNKCEICSTIGKTVFDHCHASGKFRGWICDRCNKTLGIVKDSPQLLLAMRDYLIAGGSLVVAEQEDGHGSVDSKSA